MTRREVDEVLANKILGLEIPDAGALFFAALAAMPGS